MIRSNFFLTTPGFMLILGSLAGAHIPPAEELAKARQMEWPSYTSQVHLSPGQESTIFAALGGQSGGYTGSLSQSQSGGYKGSLGTSQSGGYTGSLGTSKSGGYTGGSLSKSQSGGYTGGSLSTSQSGGYTGGSLSQSQSARSLSGSTGSLSQYPPPDSSLSGSIESLSQYRPPESSLSSSMTSLQGLPNTPNLMSILNQPPNLMSGQMLAQQMVPPEFLTHQTLTHEMVPQQMLTRRLLAHEMVPQQMMLAQGMLPQEMLTSQTLAQQMPSANLMSSLQQGKSGMGALSSQSFGKLLPLPQQPNFGLLPQEKSKSNLLSSSSQLSQQGKALSTLFPSLGAGATARGMEVPDITDALYYDRAFRLHGSLDLPMYYDLAFAVDGPQAGVLPHLYQQPTGRFLPPAPKEPAPILWEDPHPDLKAPGIHPLLWYGPPPAEKGAQGRGLQQYGSGPPVDAQTSGLQHTPDTRPPFIE